MLIALSISQFAIAEKLDIEFEQGMTTITGETGAGKSIALDALGLALGARAGTKVVRYGAEKADIRAVFDLANTGAAVHWLKEHDFDTDDDCILRRVITKEGRSKAYINGQPVNLQTLKELGDLLVDIHSQHAHHQLLQRDYHQVLLDAYADCEPLLEKTGKAFKAWQDTARQIQQLQNQNNESETRKEYLQFQLEEFHDLALQPDEFQKLEAQHALISNAEHLREACMVTLDICRDGDNAVTHQLQHCLGQLEKLTEHSADIKDAFELINSANIQVMEACQSLKSQLSHEHGDAESLQQIEDRMASILDLARKHRVQPSELADTQASIEEEMATLDNSSERIETLTKQASKEHKQYQSLARQLTQLRETASENLAFEIKQQLKQLGMENCEFVPLLNTDTETPRSSGYENVEFLVSTNPGLPPQGLHKIASGGELSRISLAIQVITAKSSTIPTLVFDEVDVGIGGGTAEVVGKLLNQLSKSAQILCVTHQPQVAAQADNHFYVVKQQDKGATQTFIKQLDKEEKVHEIARMLGGIEMTQATIDHAREMLDAK